MLRHMENGVGRWSPPVGGADRFVHVMTNDSEAHAGCSPKQVPVARKRVKAGGVLGSKGTKMLNKVRAKPYLVPCEILSEIPFRAA